MADHDGERPVHILVVANRTAAAQRLLDEVRRRSEHAPCRFALLIPQLHERNAHDWTVDVAVPLVRRAARAPVESLAGGPDPLMAVENALRDESFDEIIISTVRRRSGWRHREFVRRVQALGLPVTVIAPTGHVTSKEASKIMLDLGAGV